MSRVPLAAVAAAALAALAGCSAADPAPPAGPGPAGDDRPARRAQPPAGRRARRASRVAAPPCPPAVAGCRRATGRVVYVERVDPDGDGDLHLVLASPQSVTAPGLTVVDVSPRLRPARVPRRGDRVGAAGPVFRGSYGQRQIEAVAVRLGER